MPRTDKRPWLQALGRRARRLRPVLDLFPATGAGLAVLVLCAAGFWFLGVLHKDVVLLPVAAAVALLVVGMVLAVGLGAALTARTLKDARFDDAFLRLEANYRRRTGVRLTPPLLPFIELSWQWLHPPQAEVHMASRWREVQEEVLPRHRCLVEGLTRRVQIQDVLGMARVAWSWTRPSRVMVLPDRGRLDQATVLHSLVGGEDYPDPYGDAHGDRVEMLVQSGTSLQHPVEVSRATADRWCGCPSGLLTARSRTCAHESRPADEPAFGAGGPGTPQMPGDSWRFGVMAARATPRT